MRAFTEIEEEERTTDTEITLGLTSLLGIFFGLVLVCGVFFGFGYSLGRGSSPSAQAVHPPASTAAAAHSTEPDLTTAASEPESNSTETADTASTAPAHPAATNTDQYKYVPTPDGPARLPANGTVKQNTVVEKLNTAKASPAINKPVDGESATPPTPARPAPVAETLTAAASPVKKSAATPIPAAATVASASPTPAALTPAAATPSSPIASPTMVQIAAVSHQEDAQVLVAALQKHGYSVVIRNDPRDSLLHVQLGPFTTRDEAKAMRAKLLADGYNAILK